MNAVQTLFSVFETLRMLFIRFNADHGIEVADLRFDHLLVIRHVQHLLQVIGHSLRRLGGCEVVLVHERVVVREQINDLEVDEYRLLVRVVFVEVICATEYLRLERGFIITCKRVVDEAVDDLRLADVAWPNDGDAEFFSDGLCLFLRVLKFLGHY